MMYIYFTLPIYKISNLEHLEFNNRRHLTIYIGSLNFPVALFFQIETRVAEFLLIEILVPYFKN